MLRIHLRIFSCQCLFINWTTI